MKHPLTTWETIVLLSWAAAILPPQLYRGVGRQTTLDGVDLLREGFSKCSACNSFWA